MSVLGQNLPPGLARVEVNAGQATRADLAFVRLEFERTGNLADLVASGRITGAVRFQRLDEQFNPQPLSVRAQDFVLGPDGRTLEWRHREARTKAIRGEDVAYEVIRSLPNGVYQVEVDLKAILGGGEVWRTDWHRLSDDCNGDGVVDAADAALLARADVRTAAGLLEKRGLDAITGALAGAPVSVHFSVRHLLREGLGAQASLTKGYEEWLRGRMAGWSKPDLAEYYYGWLGGMKDADAVHDLPALSLFEARLGAAGLVDFFAMDVRLTGHPGDVEARQLSARVQANSVERLVIPLQTASDRAVVPAGGEVLIDVLRNDRGSRAGIRIDGFSKARNGTLDAAGAGRFVYRPKRGFSGEDTFTYDVVHQTGGRVRETVRIEVVGEVPGGVKRGGLFNRREETPVYLPATGLNATQLGLLVNRRDSFSKAVAAYYADVRGVPAENIFEVDLPDRSREGRSYSFTRYNTVTEADASFFADQVSLAREMNRIEPMLRARQIEALLVTWKKPYLYQVRDGASGDWRFAASLPHVLGLGLWNETDFKALGDTDLIRRIQAYARSESIAPSTEFGVRPTFMIGYEDISDLGGYERTNYRSVPADVRRLIDRGVQAEGSLPEGECLIVRTKDKIRSNLRLKDYETFLEANPSMSGLNVVYHDNSDGKESVTCIRKTRFPVMFYFSAAISVSCVEWVNYLPGSIGDHLTSFGGCLVGTTQMTVNRWIEVGCSATYGTVSEPGGSFLRFPQVSRLIPAYVRGATAAEAYWRSVDDTRFGLFFGDPLARPYGHGRPDWRGGDCRLATSALDPARTYQLVGHETVQADGGVATRTRVILEPVFTDRLGVTRIEFPDLGYEAYELREKTGGEGGPRGAARMRRGDVTFPVL